MTLTSPPTPLAQLEARLGTHLLALGAVGLVLGTGLGGWTWGVSALAGVVGSFFYYRLLGVQVRAQIARNVQPKLIRAIVSILGRQAVCALTLVACFLAFGNAWWACVAAMLVARHWVIVLAAVPTPTQPVADLVP